eukprot:11202801-Alexandrium_andersonii.AAC.1
MCIRDSLATRHACRPASNNLPRSAGPPLLTSWRLRAAHAVQCMPSVHFNGSTGVSASVCRAPANLTRAANPTHAEDAYAACNCGHWIATPARPPRIPTGRWRAAYRGAAL